MAELKMDITKMVEETVLSFKAQGWFVSKWISVEDRLPEEEGNYLVTRDGNLGHSIVDIATWFKSTTANNGFHKANRVSAWMPLPEVFNGGEQDG